MPTVIAFMPQVNSFYAPSELEFVPKVSPSPMSSHADISAIMKA